MVLDKGLPAMGDHPASDEVVIVSVQLEASPCLVSKTIREIVLLKDFGAIRHGSARQTWETTVNVRTRRNVEVPSLQITRPKKVPDAGVGVPAKPLAGPNTTHLGVFEGRQDPIQQIRWPYHVVIGKNRDSSHDFWYGAAHLTALVGVVDAQNSNAFPVDL
jgi:hypothetical protein